MTRVPYRLIGIAAAAFTLMLSWGLVSTVFAVEEAGHAAAAVEATHGNAHGSEATGADSHDGGHGKPQLIAKPNAGLITSLTTLIIFVVLLVVLSKFAWGPIASGLKAREDKIRKDIADAEAARARAEATLRDYQTQLSAAEAKVREMINSAAAEGERVAANIRTHAQQESEEIKERTTRDIEAAKNNAIGEIYAQAANLATSVAEKILRKNLNAEDQRDLVNRSLEQMQTLNKN